MEKPFQYTNSQFRIFLDELAWRNLSTLLFDSTGKKVKEVISIEPVNFRFTEIWLNDKNFAETIVDMANSLDSFGVL